MSDITHPLPFGGMAPSEYRLSAWWVLPISAIAWWICGFLPWLAQVSYRVTGLITPSGGGVGGFLPLPFTVDDAIVRLVVMALIGGLFAGVASRLSSSAGAGAAAAIAGTLLGIVTTGGASWWLVIRQTVPDDGRPLGMLVVTGIAGLVGLAAGLLAALGPTVSRGVALALPVVFLDGWFCGLVPGGSVSPPGTWWIFAIALGVALGLAVDGRPVQLMGWLPTAGAVWVLQGSREALLAVQENLWPGSELTENPWSAVGLVWNEIASAAIVTEGHQLGAWVVALLLGGTLAALRLSREAADEGERAEAWV